jgi:NADH:ubiquinone oxidoreductase subunit 2 (subunit N)
MMYMHEPGEAANQVEPLPLGLKAALILPALATLALGIFPSWVLNFAGKSSALIR